MPSYQPGRHHEVLCAALDRIAAGECKRLIVCMPPRHGKTEHVSRRFPAWYLGHNPRRNVLGCSHTASLAADINRDVQRIMDGEAYRELYPEVRLSGRNVRTVAGPLPLRNSEVFQIVSHGGSYRAAGVGQAIAGRGFNLGIIDDPFANREAADSPTQREAVWKWYNGDFLTRRENEDAAILINHTRWHPEDLVGRLLRLQEEDPSADQWEVLNLPAIAKEIRHPEDTREPGQPLWPQRFPLEHLDKIRRSNPYDWFSQYQQEPRAPGSVEWPDELFTGAGFWFDDWPSLLGIKVMALDPSKGSESKTGDWQALILWGRASDGTEYVECDMAKRPMVAPRTPDDTVALGEGMVENAVEMYRKFQPEAIAVETNVFAQLLTIPFRQEARRRRMEVRILCIDNRTNKAVRIRRLGDALSQRKIRFRRTAGTRLLVEQLKQFNVGDHDDGPDALEMARRVAMELWAGRHRK